MTTAPTSPLSRAVLPADCSELVAGLINPTPELTPVTRASEHDHDHDHATPLAMRLANLGGVVVPMLGVVAAMILLWGVAFSWVYLGLLIGMYLVTGLGITVGYHRYFTHKSFDTSRPVVALLGVAGSMAVQGPVFEWAATHRQHHQHSDDHDDPHSPHTHGSSGFLGMLKGAWHSHVGWLMRTRPADMDRYIPDLRKDRLITRINDLFPLWVLLGLAIPAVLGGVLTMSWTGVLLGFLWGGLVRVFMVHHLTWSINSVCHIWGSRPYESHDHSRNNAIFGIFALGEGWHNNHHAFPASARHGLAWWQFDLSYILIRSMAALRLVKNVRVPSADRLAAKLKKM